MRFPSSVGSVHVGNMRHKRVGREGGRCKSETGCPEIFFDAFKSVSGKIGMLVVDDAFVPRVCKVGRIFRIALWKTLIPGPGSVYEQAGGGRFQARFEFVVSICIHLHAWA